MYGLLGYPLGHSFSKGWFAARGVEYSNFEFPTVEEFLTAMPADLQGFNVTIPHKQSIVPFLTRVDESALEVGAINCVKINNKELIGFNTDIIGFEQTLSPLIGEHHRRAAILGSGGASLAVQYVMRRMSVPYDVISRSNGGYIDFDPSQYQMIINTTPLGMSPNIESAPPINYDAIDSSTICYDLVYNPAQTEFLRRCRRRGAVVIGGIAMLESQAEAALAIFEQGEADR